MQTTRASIKEARGHLGVRLIPIKLAVHDPGNPGSAAKADDYRHGAGMPATYAPLDIALIHGEPTS